jgi:hypothetical protein
MSTMGVIASEGHEATHVGRGAHRVPDAGDVDLAPKKKKKKKKKKHKQNP